MVRFEDGPAAGILLALRRIPILLRVVRSTGGERDALDQLTDEPRAGDMILVYRRRDDLEITKYHVLCRRGRGGGNPTGWYWNASYSVLAEQPGDEHVRTTAAWQKWAQANAPAQTEKRSP